MNLLSTLTAHLASAPGLAGGPAVVVHGLVLAAQAMLLGGVLFLLLLARPQGWLLGRAGLLVQQDSARIAGWAALGLVLAEGMALAMQASALMATTGLPLDQVLRSAFALLGLVKIAMAFLLAAVLFGLGGRAPGWLLLPLGAVVLAAAALAPHAATRPEWTPALLAAGAVHQFGAALWIGGLPCFVAALRRVNEAAAWEVIGSRFSRMSMLGVVCIALSGAGMADAYIGDWPGVYGTVYGLLVGVTILLFLALLGLGCGSFLAVRRLRISRGRSEGASRLRCFAEVQTGVGFTLFFIAAALAALPPAAGSPQTWLTTQAIGARIAAHWAWPGLNATGMPWSDYLHHWAGISVLAIGLLALLNQAGVRSARHWPVLLLGLAGFLFLRTSPEAWPFGATSLGDSLRDLAAMPQRAFAILLALLALLEWRVQATGQRSGWQPLVFPLAWALGAAALLLHSPAKQQALTEWTLVLLTLAGMATGWARWLDIRLNPPGNRVAGWIWPLCVLAAGVLLLFYQAA